MHAAAARLARRSFRATRCPTWTRMWVEPLEARVLLSAIYSANMDVNPGWSLQGLWQYGTPTSNPSYAPTGSHCIGVNLAGNYLDNMGAQYATTPAINCMGYEDVYLSFQRWMGIESSWWDQAAIQVSSNGVNWNNVWTHGTNSFSDVTWTQQNINISAYADNQPSVYIRWQMGPTDSSVVYTGWQIDDVVVSGTPAAPTAQLQTQALRATGQASHTLEVLYTSTVDDLNVGTLNSDDLGVRSPDDVNLSVTYLGVTQTSEQTWLATYEVGGPGGVWDANDAGVYTVSIGAAQVLDMGGRQVVAGDFDTFKAWRVLPLDARTPANYTDKDGDAVSITLKGPGSGEVLLLGEDADADRINLAGTSVASTLSVKVTGPDGHTGLPDTAIDGGLKALAAPMAQLSGSLDIDGDVKTLTLGDVSAGSSINLNGAIASTITLGHVAGLELNTTSAIKCLTAVEWLSPDFESEVSATSIKTLNITGGDFLANLALDASLPENLALGTARIAGRASDAQWNILGQVGAITLGDHTEDWDIEIHGGLKSLTAASIEDSDLNVYGAIGTVTVQEWRSGQIAARTLKCLTTTGGQGDDGPDGDLFIDLELHGFDEPEAAGADEGPAPVILGKVNVAGDVGDNWMIDGSVGTVVIGDEADAWDAEIGGAVKSLRVGTFLDATLLVSGAITTLATGSGVHSYLSAACMKTFTCAGDWSSGQIHLTDHEAALAVSKLTVGGRLDESLITANASVGAVCLGYLRGSRILVSVEGDSLPDSVNDFTAQHEIKSFTVTGVTSEGNPHSQIDSMIAAWRLGTLNLRNVQLDNDGDVHGFAATQYGSFRLVQPDSSVYTDPDDIENPLDFVVRRILVPT
jgi:hypothetical protein